MIIFLGAETIVMKFGTNSLTTGNHNRLNPETIERIASLAAGLYSQRKKPVIVTSGAVAAGMELNGLGERPSDVSLLQQLSAEGARLLWNMYASAFSAYDIGTIYIPVTWHCFQTIEEKENIRQMFKLAASSRKILIFNTNDALTSQELVARVGGFYDNDPLAVNVSACIGADALVFFTDNGNMGTGGGYSKIRSIEQARKAGIYVAVYGISQLEAVFGTNY